jgi:predicted ATPase
MTGIAQPDFRDTELDPELLSTPFKVQTNWHVITGAPCSGKSTLIDQLADKGFQTFPEVARQYFAREFAKGRTIDEIREDPAKFTRQIFDLWLELLRDLHPSEVIFHDRGLPDGFAFYRYAGMNPNEILPDCFRYRYASVFLLNRLPYQLDDVRAGDDALAAYYESWTLRDFAALGYNVVRVPVLPPEERLAFILERLSL